MATQFTSQLFSSIPPALQVVLVRGAEFSSWLGGSASGFPLKHRFTHGPSRINNGCVVDKTELAIAHIAKEAGCYNVTLVV